MNTSKHDRSKSQSHRRKQTQLVTKLDKSQVPPNSTASRDVRNSIGFSAKRNSISLIKIELDRYKFQEKLDKPNKIQTR